ncbi:MAG: hypothetical protein K8R77_15155 [Anaerolineaceae bacterium]|nr:hypothetical protein [Anaerolineaceae bacterium]
MKRIFVLVGVLIMALISLSGCSLPVKAEPTAEIVAQAPTDVPLPPPTEAPTVEPPPPTATPEPEIVHVALPAGGNGKGQMIHDQLSQETAPEKRAYGGDEYPIGRYERPFTAEEMEYLPFIDIVQTDLIRDEDGGWIYTDIVVVESPSSAGDRRLIYGIELDNDLDGRGDVLVLAEKPESSEWTTDGVHVWKDVNENIGSKEPMRSDAPHSDDGYEVQVFDAGKGEDADLAWVRLSPEMNNKIEIAFKLDLVDIGEEYYFFLWGAWTFVDEAHPEWFDHHDRFTLEEAGSPLEDNPQYPLKAFFGADNTCRALSGLTPTSQLPGMCPMTVPQASGGEERCPAENCCPSATTACFFHWDYGSCSCVPN